ncbi:MAG: 30S ribosomal protein S13 [Patescibacteria group bacterium]|jgi:small subunit ribosomal protein S13
MAQNQVRIAGVELPVKKRIEISLTSIFGVGISVSRRILERARISVDKRTYDLTDDEIARIRSVIEGGDVLVEGNLRQKVYQDIKRLRDIRSYRGIRHKIGLPVRGQRTRHNARTRKGKVRVAVGGLNKKIDKK